MKSLLYLSIISPCWCLWPIPIQFQRGNQTLWISPDTKFEFNNKTDLKNTKEETFQWPFLDKSTQSSGPLQQGAFDSPSTIDIIDAAIGRTREQLFLRNFIPWKFYPKRSQYEPSNQSKIIIDKVKLVLEETPPKSKDKSGTSTIDESYTVNITHDGKAVISGKSAVGISHGLKTLTQLFYKHSKSGYYTSYAPISITDAPRFQHRGVNLDVARHFFSVETIKHVVDAMAMNKLNRLHLHITDAQSWPLEIERLPDLAKKGAYTPDLIYSAKDVRDIQYHAALHGIEVYLEIDLPGHTASIESFMPELIAAYDIQPDWSSFAASPPSGTLKLNSSKADKFLDDVFDDVLPRVRQLSSHFHTGGDEVNLGAYRIDETMNTSDFLKIKPFVQKLVDKVHGKILSAGLVPIVYQEMAQDWALTLDKRVIVQAWQDLSSIDLITRSGFQVIVGTQDIWYLDCGYGQWINPSSNSNNAGYEACSPRKNWRRIYSYDPLFGLDAEQQKLVIGGECHLWTEQTDAANLDVMLWPRASAVSEVLWSGAKDANGKERSQVDSARRLSEFRERMVAFGIMAEPIQMPYCLMNANACNA